MEKKLLDHISSLQQDDSRIVMSVHREGPATRGHEWEWCWKTTTDPEWLWYWWSMWNRAWNEVLKSVYRRGMAFSIYRETDTTLDGYPYTEIETIADSVSFDDLECYLTDPQVFAPRHI